MMTPVVAIIAGSSGFREFSRRAGVLASLPGGEALLVLRMERARAKRGARGAPRVGARLVRTGRAEPRALREKPFRTGD